jgi:hypothetical protein
VEREQLKVRNKIYQRAFGQDWIAREQELIAQQEHVERSRTPIWLMALLALLVSGALGAVGFFVAQQQQATTISSSEQARQAALSIRDSADAKIRWAALATLFRLGYAQQARDEFFALPFDQQQTLLKTVPESAADLTLVIRGLWGQLDLFSADDPLGHRQLLEEMRITLGDAGQAQLRDELSGTERLRGQGAAQAQMFSTALAAQAQAATALAAAVPPAELASAPANLLLYQAYTGLAASPPDLALALASLEALARMQAATPQAPPLELPARAPEAESRLAAAAARPAYSLAAGTGGELITASGFSAFSTWLQIAALRDRFLQSPADYPSLAAIAGLADGVRAQATGQAQQAATSQAATAQAQQSATAQAQQATSQMLIRQQEATGEALTATALAPSPTPTSPPPTSTSPPPTATRVPTSAPAQPTRVPAQPTRVQTDSGGVPVPTIPGG